MSTFTCLGICFRKSKFHFFGLVNYFRGSITSRKMSLSKIALNLARKKYLCSANVAAIRLEQLTRNFNNSRVNFAKKPDWNRAVSEAEKIVGYPTSFLSLRWLLSDEIANVALQLRKLVGSNHPLLKTAKGLFYNGKNNMQTWGLIVLLVSKAAGHSADIPDMEEDKAAGVLQSQRALAEVTEMIRTSHLIHKGMVNMQPPIQVEVPGDMIVGNKIALLSGDYLLSNSCLELANLENQDLVELMSSAVRDLAEAEFVGPRDAQNAPLPAKPRSGEVGGYEQFVENPLDPLVVSEALGDARAEWTLRHVLNAGSLLGKSCQGALKLAGHPESLQRKGYLFGRHLALAWQACLDCESFTSNSTEPFSLVSAPVLFALQHDPTMYELIEKGMDDTELVDYAEVKRRVLAGPAMSITKQLQREHSKAALEGLEELPETDAKRALANIIEAMQD